MLPFGFVVFSWNFMQWFYREVNQISQTSQKLNLYLLSRMTSYTVLVTQVSVETSRDLGEQQLALVIGLVLQKIKH